MWKPACVYLIIICLISCATSRQNAFHPDQKFSTEQLKQDYVLFKNVLEESHPSLYWYTYKDSLDYFFDYGYTQIKDSMTEPQFRTLLSYVVSKINCGHTTVKASKRYLTYFDTVKNIKLFPLGLKFWKDTMVITTNINRKDTALKRGMVIQSFNGLSQKALSDTLFQYISTDGYNETSKYQQLSNTGGFASLYRNVFGISDSFFIRYIDYGGNEQQTIVRLYNPRIDTTVRRQAVQPPKKLSKKERRERALFSVRSLQIDTGLSSGYMTLNSFSRGNQLKSFFKRSFESLQQNHIQHLVIDVRNNGGGDAFLSTLLTRYVVNKKFKLADSLYAIRRGSKYSAHIEKNFFYWLGMQFVTRKRSDGFYHFGYFERHYFHPKRKDHFNGKVYIITGGNSFSATSLFAGLLKGQPNVTIVGEETGGSAYGNTAWMIPDVTLPNTKIRFRLPKFHLVIDKDAPKTGRGVQPDVLALPTTEAIKKGVDFKAEKVKALILQAGSKAN